MTDNTLPHSREAIQLLSDEELAERYLAGAAENNRESWAFIQEEFSARGGVVEAGGSDVSGPLVTVFASGDTGALIMAKMLLEAEHIPFVTEGELVQDLFSPGRLFSGTNFITGPARLQVAESQADLAREILSDVEP